MKEVSQDTYDSVMNPWQSPVLEAFREFNADQLLEKIAIAEDAISKRLLKLDGSTNPEERSALDNAQRTLMVLKEQRSRR